MLSVTLCQSMYRTAALQHKNCTFTPTKKLESWAKAPSFFSPHAKSDQRSIRINKTAQAES